MDSLIERIKCAWACLTRKQIIMVHCKSEQPNTLHSTTTILNLTPEELFTVAEQFLRTTSEQMDIRGQQETLREARKLLTAPKP